MSATATHNQMMKVLRNIIGAVIAMLMITPAGARAADDQLIIQGQKAAYMAYDRIEFSYGGCATSGSTRLELRADSPTTGNIISAYPAPAVNAAGYVRAAALLPDTIQRGNYYLVFQCLSPTSAVLSASALIKVEVISLNAATPVQPTVPATTASGVATLTPKAPVVADKVLAKTGIDAIIIFPVLLAIALIGLIAVKFARKPAAITWSASGTHFDRNR
ncbi:MAG: hypothetical protein EXQ64_07895 [Ilumatobacteraceae bacterium]|nr:hypothetical protein [Ilumatobacteraceae bacterium]